MPRFVIYQRISREFGTRDAAIRHLEQYPPESEFFQSSVLVIDENQPETAELLFLTFEEEARIVRTAKVTSRTQVKV